MTYTLEELNKMVDDLPEGGWLDLRSLTSIPEGFNPTVGGDLDLRSLTASERKKVKVRKLRDGDYVPGNYLFCDGILTHVAKVKRVGQYTLYVGKIPNRHVVSDGTNFAHCKTLRQGISDLAFKNMKDRGSDQYKNVSRDTEMTVEEMVTMYRIITGACSQGSERFVESLGQLKERYTVAEAIKLTRGQYNAERFAEFFER